MNGKHLQRVEKRLKRVADWITADGDLAYYRAASVPSTPGGLRRDRARDVARLMTVDLPELIAAVREANHRFADAAARERRQAAQAAADALARMPGTSPGLPGMLTCAEIECMADLLRAHSYRDQADALVAEHAAADCEGDEHWQGNSTGSDSPVCGAESIVAGMTCGLEPGHPDGPADRHIVFAPDGHGGMTGVAQFRVRAQSGSSDD